MHPNNAKVAIEAWSRIDRDIPMGEVLAALEINLNPFGWARVQNENSMPDFMQHIEYRIKHIHWRHIAEFEKHADDPSECENWEFSVSMGENWERFKKGEKPCWEYHTKYRRNPPPKPDKYGWLPIENLTIGEPVDLYNQKDKFYAQINVVVTSTYTKGGILRLNCLRLNCSGYEATATHFRPSTGAPE